MKKFLLLLLIPSSFTVYGQTKQEIPPPPKMTPEMTEFYSPLPRIVAPGKSASDIPVPAPSDAIILFNGTDLSQWQRVADQEIPLQGNDTSKIISSDGEPAMWTVKDGVLTVNKSAGDIRTKLSFGDFQLHIEWRIPEGIHGKGQSRGNSGIFLQGIYELQILDSYNNETYVNGQSGSIYKQTAPLVNAMMKPGEWNIFDVIYIAPTFREDGTYRTSPTVSVLHNGVIVQNHTMISGTTPYIGLPKVRPHGKGPIRLQAHGDQSEPISFRNIWIREL
jgi:hypothetical protein